MAAIKKEIEEAIQSMEKGLKEDDNNNQESEQVQEEQKAEEKDEEMKGKKEHKPLTEFFEF